MTTQRLRPAGTREPGSGQALEGVELRIVREETGERVEMGEVGRIQLRGPTLFSGYLAGHDKPLRRPLTEDGFFDTGDLGALDEQGRLFVHARRTDLIVTGGENVYPAEVELALEVCPDIQRAVVFGVPDERWGQIVAVGLVLGPSHTDNTERASEVLLEASKRLAPHKRPRLFTTTPALPLSAAGKLDRAAARRELTPLLRPAPRLV